MLYGDGAGPVAALVFDAAGNLYGTTEGGGAGFVCNGGEGCGTVFELSPRSGGGWKEKVLYSFRGPTDGGVPLAGLVLDAAGDLYGTTYAGRTGGASGGTVFELVSMPGGIWNEQVLHSFPDGPSDGYALYGALTLDAAGNLYGTTGLGGSSCEDIGCGTVFEVSPQSGGSWTETVLYAFLDVTDGDGPFAGVTFDASGNLYGTTYMGGIAGYGTVFELFPQQTGMWQKTILHSFTGMHGDGSRPTSDLILGSKGHVYGTTELGGDAKCIMEGDGCGTVFKVTP